MTDPTFGNPTESDVRAAGAALDRPASGVIARHPLLELLAIAGPTVATMTSYTLMQFADKVMVSRIGPDPVYVGSQGNGGLAAWAPLAAIIGVITIVNTFVSQNLGAGTPRRGARYAWSGLWLAVAGSALLIPYAVLLPTIFASLGHTGHRLELESDYGRILVAGSVLTLATRAISQYFYGMHRAGVVLVAGLAGNLTNLGFNWLLIYGNWGFPAWGVSGAGVATLIGSAVELVIPMALFLGPRYHRDFGTRSAWKPSWPEIRDLVRVGWPGGLMFGNEMICWGIFMVYMVGLFGPDHSTAGWIAHQWMSLSFMPAVGISIAVTAVVGRYIGMGRHDLAARRAWLGASVALAYMGLCGAAFVLFRDPMVRAFIQPDTPPETAERLVALGGRFLIATATFQLFDALAMTICGALRGAGDTVFLGVVTVAASWTVIVGGGLALVRFAPGLESLGPWIAASAYIILLACIVAGRFLGGRWKRIRLLKPSAGEH